jgi:hypothetical protein
MKLFESKALHNALILLGFFLTALYGYGHFIDNDVIQMLDRAHILVTQGIFTHFGNASTSGSSGYTPGSFLTFITGVPMMIWFSPWAALLAICLLHFLGFLMLINVLKNFLGKHVYLLVIVFFWLNPWRMSEVFLWNPAYIYFVSLLHMWSAYHLSKKASFRFSVIHGLSLFLGLQVHPSFIILFFMTMILLWMKALKPNFLGTFTGILLGLLSLIPYLLVGLKNPHIFPHAGGGGEGFLFFGLVKVYPMLKGFWYWILFGSTIFQTHVFHQVSFNWIENKNLHLFFKYFWTVIKYIFGVTGVLLSFYANYTFFRKNKQKFNIFKFKMTDSKDWLNLYILIAFISGLIATAISPTNPIYWHLLYFWPMAIIPLLILLDNYLKNLKYEGRVKKYIFLIIIYFTFANTFAGISSKKHDISQSFDELYFKICKENCLIERLNQTNQ